MTINCWSPANVLYLLISILGRLPYKEEMEDMFQNRFDLVSITDLSFFFLSDKHDKSYST